MGTNHSLQELCHRTVSRSSLLHPFCVPQLQEAGGRLLADFLIDSQSSDNQFVGAFSYSYHIFSQCRICSSRSAVNHSAAFNKVQVCRMQHGQEGSEGGWRRLLVLWRWRDKIDAMEVRCAELSQREMACI